MLRREVEEEEQVYVVDDDAYGVHAITEQELQQEQRFESVRVDQLVDLMVLLCKYKNLPLVLVNYIVRFTGWTIGFECSTSESVRDQWMNHKYLTLALHDEDKTRGVEHLLHQCFELKCVLLVVDTVSHDQGWATEGVEYNGTYHGSHTWSELAFEKHQHQHQHQHQQSQEQHTETQVEDDSSQRVYVICNKRAARGFRHHRRFFTSPTVLKQLHLGDQVHLMLRSMYPGWVNFVKYARLAAFFELQMSDTFDADSPQVVQLRQSLMVDEVDDVGGNGLCVVQ